MGYLQGSKRALRGLLAASLAAGAVGVWGAGPAGADAPPFGYADTSTIEVQETPTMVDLDGAWPGHQPDPRLWDVTMKTESIFVAGTNPPPPPAVDPVVIPIKARIYLPAGYDHDRAAGYPVLYLLHGGNGQWYDWSNPDTSKGGNITDVIDDSSFPGITVMLEGGKSGWYSDWQGETDGNFRPEWETYHVEQLVPWVDANLNTVDDRLGRSIAGVSMGGLGAMRYAAHHPDVFSAVGTFSGAVEMRHEPFQDTVSNSMWAFGATVVNQGLGQTEYRMTTGEPPEEEETSRLEALFGPSSPPVGGETRPGWPTINPVELAESGAFDAYGDNLAMYSGDLQGEGDIAIMNNALHSALGDVRHRYCQGPGSHSWPYFQNDLRDFLEHIYGTTPSTCTVNKGWGVVP